MGRPSATGPLQTFAFVRSAHRGRRYPAGTPTGAVIAALRLRCGARLEAAPKNSLRSLRSLRSNSFGESVDDARCRAPASTLRSSPPQRSRPPGTACREARVLASPARSTTGSPKAGPGSAGRACGTPRSAAMAAARESAPRDLTCRSLFERSERSERSEFGHGPGTRASQGTFAQRRQAA